MKLGSNYRKQYYGILDQYITDHVDTTVEVTPSKLSDMCAILCPDIPVSHVKSVCTNFIYLLFYLMKQKKLKVKLPETFARVDPNGKIGRPRKAKVLDTVNKT